METIQKQTKPVIHKNIFETSNMIKIGVLAALAFILMLFDVPLPFFPAFLKIDISDMPAVIGTFAMGPVAGVMIELIKNILKIIIKNDTGGIGEAANFLVGIAYMIPLGLIYKYKKNLKSVIAGMTLATISMVLIASIANYYVFIPLFAAFYGAPIDYFVETAAAINQHVVDLKSYILLAVVPFNLLKAILISVIGYGLFKMLQPILNKKLL